MNILVTGGAGYIGSHTVLELLHAGHAVVVADNLSNSSREALRRVEALAGKSVPFYQADIRDKAAFGRIFDEYELDCCIHFAGLKAVGDSVREPLTYYENNVGGTVTLLELLQERRCKNFVFSSSATVYGVPPEVPVPETCPKGQCANPYGRTKSMIEDILVDLQTADPAWNVVLLRYFNPVGAHPSGRIGEDPAGIPNNLMPYVTQVAVGRLPQLTVFGDDYATPDGTGVRDYIHVVDLAKGHVAALQAIERKCGTAVYNLGTGRGCSVLELVHAFEAANGIQIPYRIGPRRGGDIDCYYADPAKAERELGWKAEKDIVDMCRDSWNWQQQNPRGYNA